MARIFLIDMELRAVHSIPGMLGTLRRLWKHEKMRHLCCFFRDSADARVEACEVHGLAWSSEPGGLERLAAAAEQAGHHPIVVSSRARLPYETLRVTRERLVYEEAAPGERPVGEVVRFRLEDVTPGECGDLAGFYARQGMTRELERVQGLFGAPQSVLQLWS